MKLRSDDKINVNKQSILHKVFKNTKIISTNKPVKRLKYTSSHYELMIKLDITPYSTIEISVLQCGHLVTCHNCVLHTKGCPVCGTLIINPRKVLLQDTFRQRDIQTKLTNTRPQRPSNIQTTEL